MSLWWDTRKIEKISVFVLCLLCVPLTMSAPFCRVVARGQHYITAATDAPTQVTTWRGWKVIILPVTVLLISSMGPSLFCFLPSFCRVLIGKARRVAVTTGILILIGEYDKYGKLILFRKNHFLGDILKHDQISVKCFHSLGLLDYTASTLWYCQSPIWGGL